MKLDRRKALSLLASGAASPLAASAKPAARYVGAVAFNHGVASGDPHTDSVLLWTRVTPSGGASGAIPVIWELAADHDFHRLVAHGVFETNADRDFAVKAIANGLRPGSEYFYRFRVGKTVSPVGRTRTLPEGAINDVVLAFVTCALYPGGYFSAYDHIA